MKLEEDIAAEDEANRAPTGACELKPRMYVLRLTISIAPPRGRVN